MSAPRSEHLGRKTWIVAKHEVVSTVFRRSFWLTTLLFPAFLLIMSLGSQLFGTDLGGSRGALPIQGGQHATGRPIGYVDEGGLIDRLPPDAPGGTLATFSNQAEAGRALQAGDIDTYYVIPADYIAAGVLYRVERKTGPVIAAQVDPLLLYALSYNLTGDATVSRLLFDPMPRLERLPQDPGSDVRPEGPLNFLVPYATMLIFYFVLVMSSGYMLQSVTKEKENRTAEMLLLSVRPRALMLGKVVGLCAVALLQMIVWLGGGLLILRNAGALFGLEEGLNLPAGFAAWGVAYFVLGFFTYASLYAAIGVMAASTREANQFVFVVLVPLIVPLFFINAFIESPGGGLATFFSMFPLTAPVSMITRLAAGPVPLWQLLSGLLLLAACAFAIVLLAARFFRADTLLSSRSLSWSRIAGELRRQN